MPLISTQTIAKTGTVIEKRILGGKYLIKTIKLGEKSNSKFKKLGADIVEIAKAADGTTTISLKNKKGQYLVQGIENIKLMLNTFDLAKKLGLKSVK